MQRRAAVGFASLRASPARMVIWPPRLQMALARDLGAMVAVGKLLDRQRVEFGADHHGGTRLGTLIDRGDAMAAQFGHDPVGAGRLDEFDGRGGLALLARRVQAGDAACA